MTTEIVAPDVHAHVMAEADRIIAMGEATERTSRDPVNQAMIHHWTEAMGDQEPRYEHGEAPPAMAQVWTMYGLTAPRDPNDPLHSMMGILTDAGFTSVLGTNCEQSYARYLRVGESVRVTTALESVVGPKATGMGVGYFVTSRSRWYVGDEPVATMLFRVLKFIPKERA